MTLIAAMRCSDGVVLCADSQETVDVPGRGQYRVQVTKIQPQIAGDYQVVIGGSGDGPLVDGFTDEFVEQVGRWTRHTRAELKGKIKRLLHKYHRNEVALSTAFEDDKILSFIICLQHKDDPSISLWKTVGPVVREVNDLTLLGWDEVLYWREARRLYRAEATSSEAMLLAVHLFSIAKETSNVISGDTRVIVARPTGFQMLEAASVADLEERLQVFTKLSDAILLALPDVSIPPREFRSYLKEFERTAYFLHLEFLARVAMLKVEKFRGLENPSEIEAVDNDPYLRLPALEELMFTEDDEDYKGVMEALEKLAKAQKEKESQES